MTSLTVNSPRTSDHRLQAMTREAKICADRLNDDLISRCQAPPGLWFVPAKETVRWIRWPIGYLLDLAAVLQLESWEQANIWVHVDAGLPTSVEAGTDLARHCWESPSSLVTVASATLFPRVFRVWLDRIVWSGHELVGAEMAVDMADDENALQAIADFLWKNRSLGVETQ
jgi:hypothetical protein